MAATAFPMAAHASDDQAKARAAIAEARGKIEAGDKVGASSEAEPGCRRQARAALANAETMLEPRRQEAGASPRPSMPASLADNALVAADRRKTNQADNATADAQRSGRRRA